MKDGFTAIKVFINNADNGDGNSSSPLGVLLEAPHYVRNQPKMFKKSLQLALSILALVGTFLEGLHSNFTNKLWQPITSEYYQIIEKEKFQLNPNKKRYVYANFQWRKMGQI